MQSLLAFEAAARHLSFTKAAQELQVTQTAISHQIRALEERLDVKLFVRVRNALTLTSEAIDYLDTVKEAIGMLAIASERTRKKDGNAVLTVACLPAYAVHCLIPRLPDFQRLHADITVCLATTSDFRDFDGDGFDVAIRYGRGRWSGMHSALLQREEFFPVCAPQLVASMGAGRTEERLARLTRLRTYFHTLYEDDWPAWLAADGAEHTRFAGEAVFQHQLTSLSAALEGVGIAIGRTPLVDRHLARGTLVEPFNLRCSSSSAYYLCTPVAKTKTTKVTRFCEWASKALAGQAGTFVREAAPRTQRHPDLGLMLVD